MKKTFAQNELPEIAALLLGKLKPANNATVVALAGDLGAGKTTLTQAIARALGIKETVISPTFVIMKSYKLSDSVFSTLVHIDAYRLNSAKELLRLGWDELISNPKNLILIEWPERVSEIIPKDATKIYLAHVDEKTRNISISKML